MAFTLKHQLNAAFRPERRKRSASGRYVAIRGDVRATVAKDHNGVWNCEIDGRHYSSVLHRELKAQLNELGFDILRAQD